MRIRKMLVRDIPEAYFLWKKTGLDVAKYQREKLEIGMVLKENPDTCFVLENEGKIIGTILGASNGRRVWIYHLAIDTSFQRKGYGTKLLRKVEKAFKKEKATKIILGLGLWNLKTAYFYERNGYKVMNDAILMAKDIYKNV